MLDKSGSCAIASLFVGRQSLYLILTYIIDDVCYIANVGDSRALMSADGGNYTVALSTDHKPNEDNEQKRITENGGKIYQ